MPFSSTLKNEENVLYRTVDKDAKFGYKSSTEEDYEEALKIVRDGNIK